MYVFVEKEGSRGTGSKWKVIKIKKHMRQGINKRTGAGHTVCLMTSIARDIDPSRRQKYLLRVAARTIIGTGVRGVFTVVNPSCHWWRATASCCRVGLIEEPHALL